MLQIINRDLCVEAIADALKQHASSVLISRSFCQSQLKLVE